MTFKFTQGDIRMPTKEKQKPSTSHTHSAQQSTHSVPCCSLPEIKDRDLSHIANGNRLRLIALVSKMWVNGTDITYHFLKSPAKLRGAAEQEQAVRNAFSEWKDLGIGVTFREVDNAADAIAKIGFNPADGAWSYLGRDNITYASAPNEQTMNFGWDLTTPYGADTALHEVGHLLGFPHEHQNPKAGIVWDEEKVYANLAGSPNFWSREQTKRNIIRKIPPNTVDGSEWDMNSIMHYRFDKGLIKEPMRFQDEALEPTPSLSIVDVSSVQKLYPPLKPNTPELRAFESQAFNIAASEQIDFIIKPATSRKYTLRTFGEMDTVMVLFEVREGIQEFMAGDDDSGEDFNAEIIQRLNRDRVYILRTRLYYAQSEGSGSVMMY